MALIDKVRWSFLPALAVAVLASCGSPSREPGQQAGSSAPFKQATVPDLSPPKGDPAGALPSQVASGEVAAFKAAPASPTMQEDRDAAGSLPSNVAAGKSAAYAPEGGQAPPSSTAPSPRIAKP
ncbi:MAG TPA: hypothetical protein VFR85_06205 [Anaeromyxobacteraceae bacterium]|nr:hypothetical protein [Anaeromyxobacteraceae bacterium]